MLVTVEPAQRYPSPSIASVALVVHTLSRPQKQYGRAPPPQTKFLDRFRWVDIPLVAVTGAG